jgi:hypothetical protein
MERSVSTHHNGLSRTRKRAGLCTDLLSALEHEEEDGRTMNEPRDCSVLGELAWFEGKPAVNEEWADPFHPLIASGTSQL